MLPVPPALGRGMKAVTNTKVVFKGQAKTCLREIAAEALLLAIPLIANGQVYLASWQGSQGWRCGKQNSHKYQHNLHMSSHQNHLSTDILFLTPQLPNGENIIAHI